MFQIILEYALKQEEKKDNESDGTDKENDDEESDEEADNDEVESENEDSAVQDKNLEVLKAKEPAKDVEPIVLIPRRKRPGHVENQVQQKKEKLNETEIEVITLDWHVSQIILWITIDNFN